VVEAGILESCLRRGLSLESIGQLAGLAAVHRDRHAPRGGIERETLEALVDEGLSTREIAERLGLSQSTVRHWLRRHDLRTHRARRENTHGQRGADPDRKLMTCARHGQTQFWLEGRGIYRCLRCRSEAVARRRRRLKQLLVEEAGAVAAGVGTTDT
jgi:DNA-binding transcriptional ArsR family regulator